jgi:hypothetical protein
LSWRNRGDIATSKLCRIRITERLFELIFQNRERLCWEYLSIKWKDIQDAVGAAEQEGWEEILCANIEKEIAMTKDDAAIRVEKRAEAEKKQDEEEAKEAKMDEFLAYVNGMDGQVRLELTATMDGAWQKRSSGKDI